MAGPFATAFENPRSITIPISPQDYDRLTMTAVASTAFADLLPVGANSRAALRVQVYLDWLTVTPNTFPAAAAGGTGFIQAEAIDAGAAVVLGPVNVKAFVWTQFNNGVLTPYYFLPSFPHRVTLAGAGLATAVNIRWRCNVTAILGAPSAIVEIGTSVDSLNTGPAGTIGGQDVIAQGANNPNAF